MAPIEIPNGMRLVQFIGPSPKKRDNVCETGTVWEARGVAKLVEQRSAALMAQYTDVWRDITEAVRHGVMVEFNGAYVSADELNAIGDVDPDEKPPADNISPIKPAKNPPHPAQAGEAAKAEAERAAVAAAGNETKPNPFAHLIPVGGFSSNREEAIREACEALTVGNPEHFTANGQGLPRVEVLEALLGYDINMAERAAGWDQVLQAREANDAKPQE